MNKKIGFLILLISIINPIILLGINYSLNNMNIENTENTKDNNSIVPIEIKAPDPKTNLTIGTSTILADFASQIIFGKGEKVESIMPGGTCPSHFDPKPSDVAKVSEADIVFSHSPFVESWLDDLLISAGNTGAKRVIGGMVGGIEWAPPENAILYVNAITSVLNQTFNQTENVSKFNTNRATFINNINGNKTSLEGIASNNGFTGIKVICRNWMQPFLTWLGFDVVVNWTQDEGMSPNDMNTLISIAKANSVSLIISNLQSGTDVGAQIAAQSNAIHVICNNFPGGVPDTPTYIDMITYNVYQLIYGKQLYDLYQTLLGGIIQERDFYQILSYLFIGISIIAIIIVVFQFVRIKKQ